MRRRELLQLALLAPAAEAEVRPRKTFAYVGCYTTEQRHGRGDGIHVYQVEPSSGAFAPIQTLGGLTNPSFIIRDQGHRTLYSVHGDGEYATSFRIDPSSGRLSLLNTAATGGVNGVHQALSPNGRFLVVANYGSGSVAVLPVGPDGALADFVQLVKLEGPPGPHRVEQTASHPHHVVFDPSGRFVLVPDKGLDRVFVFQFDQDTGKLASAREPFFQARSGTGPRHLAFHPALPFVYVLNELGNSVTVCRWNLGPGSLEAVQIMPSLPAEFTRESTAAEITVHRNGRFLYCSNRGHDSIAIFAIQRGSGLLRAAAWVPTRGKSPRFIGFDPSGQFLYAANEQGDNVSSFRAAASTGQLAPVGAPIPNNSAVTIAFATPVL